MGRRVLWIVKGLGPGGAERLLATHAAHHDRADFDVTCAYVLPWKDHLAEELSRHDVETVCVSNRRRDLLWPIRLGRLVRSGNWDVVHVHSPLPGSVARLAIRCMSTTRRPLLISTEHNTWTSHRRLTRLLNRWTSRWNDRTFAVTDEVRSSMTNGRSRATETLRHGIDVDIVRELRSERFSVRQEFGLGQDTVVIGTVANFRAQKDYPNLLRAVRLLADGSRPVHLLAVGQGPAANGVAALVEQLGLSDVVTLTGYRSDAPRVMAAVDVFTMASRWEGLPVAVMEATALGLPIVATAVGGLAEHFTDGVDALLVPPGDSAALADALESVVHDERRRRALGDSSAARATDFGAAPSITRIENAYRTRPAPANDCAETPRSTRRSPAPASSRPRLSSGIDIRPATPDDRAAVIDLCRAALGWGDDPRFEQLFAWKHDDNAFGPSFQWVAVDQGQIVGLRAFMRWEFVRDGEVLRTVRAVDTAVHPDHQGGGLFTAMTMHGLDEVRADGVDFVFNTPNAKSRPGYLKMGWKDVGRLPVSIRPRSLTGLATAARSRVAADHWPDANRSVGNAFDVNSMRVARHGGTDDRRLSTRVDDAFLAWRYGLPMLGYRMLDVEEGDLIVRTRRRGRGGELVVLHHDGVSQEDADRAIRAGMSSTGASHALGLGTLPGSHSIPAPGVGPNLTWRPLKSKAQPHISHWALTMGDIELF